MMKQKQTGFTIIEVVLVLAIAGLIFLMIFIALPALQRGQRDTARKNDASTVAAAINTYKSNNRNNITALTDTNLEAYIETLNQYDTTALRRGADGASSFNTAHVDGSGAYKDFVWFFRNKKCGTGNAAVVGLTPQTRSVAVVVALENNGSQLIAHCVGA